MYADVSIACWDDFRLVLKKQQSQSNRGGLHRKWEVLLHRNGFQ